MDETALTGTEEKILDEALRASVKIKKTRKKRNIKQNEDKENENNGNTEILDLGTGGSGGTDGERTEGLGHGESDIVEGSGIAGPIAENAQDTPKSGRDEDVDRNSTEEITEKVEESIEKADNQEKDNKKEKAKVNHLALLHRWRGSHPPRSR